jgi:SM-20-related protein
MIELEFFSRFGICIQKSFIDSASCRRLREEMRSAAAKPATVASGDKLEVDDKFRKVNLLHVSPETKEAVTERLLRIKPQLETYFNLQLNGCENPQFLRYGVGDFYRPHHDGAYNPDDTKYVQDRRVSVIVFLNSENDIAEPDSYSGGAVAFYGILEDQRLKKRGFPLNGQEGLMVAFRSEILHEVRLITRGDRFSIVTWFF